VSEDECISGGSGIETREYEKEEKREETEVKGGFIGVCVCVKRGMRRSLLRFNFQVELYKK